METPAVAVTVRVEKLSGPSDYVGQPRVDGRTGLQWLKAAIAYCNFRSGDAWRRLSDPDQRNDEERWYYIHGARTLTDVIFAPEPCAQIAPVLSALPSDTPSLFELELAQRFNRAELVARLVKANPELTNVRLLSHYTKMKLAGMICRAERAAVATERRAA